MNPQDNRDENKWSGNHSSSAAPFVARPAAQYDSPEGRLWTVDEACVILHVGRSTLYEIMSEGRLSYKRVTERTRLISDHDLQEYLQSCKSSHFRRWKKSNAKAS